MAHALLHTPPYSSATPTPPRLTPPAMHIPLPPIFPCHTCPPWTDRHPWKHNLPTTSSVRWRSVKTPEKFRGFVSPEGWEPWNNHFPTLVELNLAVLLSFVLFACYLPPPNQVEGRKCFYTCLSIHEGGRPYPLYHSLPDHTFQSIPQWLYPPDYTFPQNHTTSFSDDAEPFKCKSLGIMDYCRTMSVQN